jgi:hypothetical protein
VRSIKSMKTMLSLICFWIGDAISRTIEPVFGRWSAWSYRIYNWFLVRSVDLQGDDSRGPWSEPSQ